jgi:hypothetical protein
MKVNLNTQCSFVLTDTGATVWNDQYADVPAMYRPAPRVAGDTVRTQLWCAMEVFGPHIHMGMAEVFTVDNEMDISE